MISSLPIPSEKETLIEILPWVHQQINGKEKTFGEQTIKSLRNLHPRIYDALKDIVSNDKNMLSWMKAYAPSKKLGFF